MAGTPNELSKAEFLINQLESRISQLSPIPILSYVATTLLAMAAIVIAAGAGQAGTAILGEIAALGVLIVLFFLILWIPRSFNGAIRRLRRLQLEVLLHQTRINVMEERAVRELISVINALDGTKRLSAEKRCELEMQAMQGITGETPEQTPTENEPNGNA